MRTKQNCLQKNSDRSSFLTTFSMNSDDALKILALMQYVLMLTGAYIPKRHTEKNLSKNLWPPTSANNFFYKQLRDNFFR
jgi:hypothetical protein